MEAKFDESRYLNNDNRFLPMWRNKKVVGIIKDEPSGKIMAEFVTLRIHWRLIFVNKIHCFTLRLQIDYFIYFKFTPDKHLFNIEKCAYFSVLKYLFSVGMSVFFSFDLVRWYWKIRNKIILCSMDTGSFLHQIEIEDF